MRELGVWVCALGVLSSSCGGGQPTAPPAEADPPAPETGPPVAGSVDCVESVDYWARLGVEPRGVRYHGGLPGAGQLREHCGSTPMEALVAACAGGDGPSCFVVGVRTTDGTFGTPISRVRARPAFARSCELGVSLGCLYSALMHMHHDRGDRGREHAVSLLESACVEGQVLACAARGDLARERWEQTSDATARDAIGVWLGRGCDGGVDRACASLGTLMLRHEELGAREDQIVSRLLAACSVSRHWRFCRGEGVQRTVRRELCAAERAQGCDDGPDDSPPGRGPRRDGTPASTRASTRGSPPAPTEPTLSLVGGDLDAVGFPAVSRGGARIVLIEDESDTATIAAFVTLDGRTGRELRRMTIYDETVRDRGAWARPRIARVLPGLRGFRAMQDIPRADTAAGRAAPLVLDESGTRILVRAADGSVRWSHPMPPTPAPEPAAQPDEPGCSYSPGSLLGWHDPVTGILLVTRGFGSSHNGCGDHQERFVSRLTGATGHRAPH